MKIVVDDKIPFIRGVLEPFADVLYKQGSLIGHEDVKNADALIIRTRTKCNKELLEGSKVRFIATATIGSDHIDTEYCREKGIKWANAPGCNSGSVMQYVASALLSYAKSENIKLEDRVLGVIGVGNVGKKVVRLAEMLGMQVLLNDPPRQEVEGDCGFISLEGILRESDILSFHVPLSMNGRYKTYHMCDKDFANKMNDNTLLINTSRGEVIDNAIIKESLAAGKFANVILDVWEKEPNISKELVDAVKIATPHIAGYSTDGKAMGTLMSVRAVADYFDLPITDWEPEELPKAGDMQITCDAKDRTWQEIITEIILKTYNIEEDDEKLRRNIEEFENLRGRYPVRREFKAYDVNLINGQESYLRKIRKLGFNLMK